MFFYRPKDAFLGDVIPFYWQGKYHLFYLYDRHAFLPGGQHIWAHAMSEDLISWEELPVAIPLGGKGEPDSFTCGTGSVIHKDGLFHIYYLGLWLSEDLKEQSQTICHATSKDLLHWEKDPCNPVLAPDRAIYNVNWKDPHVFYHHENNEYLMAITAGLEDRPAGRQGCLAVMASKDLETWEYRKPLLASSMYDCLECPDVFYWNGWWYILFSIFIPTFKTVYRMAKSLNGPWRSASIEALDDGHFYAGKTAWNGTRRLLFGWVQSKSEEKDGTYLLWGGNLAVRELVQEKDGALSVKIPDTRIFSGDNTIKLNAKPQIGKWDIKAREFENEWNDGFSSMEIFDVNKNSQIRFLAVPKENTRSVGVFLRMSGNLKTGYCLKLDLVDKRMLLGSVKEGHLYNTVSQSLKENWNEYNCIITMEDSIIEVFVNDSLCLTGRFYEHKGSILGLFAEEGGAVFKNVEIVSI